MCRSVGAHRKHPLELELKAVVAEHDALTIAEPPLHLPNNTLNVAKN